MMMLKTSLHNAISLPTKAMGVLALALLPALLGSCATPAPAPLPAPAPIVQAPAPAPVITAPAPIVVKPLAIRRRDTQSRMNDALVRGAVLHAAFMGTANRAYSLPIATPEELNSLMDGLAIAYSPRLGAGMMSYGALVGAQNTEFVDSVLSMAQAEGVDAIIYRLYADPNFAQSFSGAYSAAVDINAAWASDISALSAAASQVKEQSYSLQKDPAWSKKRADTRKDRIAAFKSAQTIIPAIASSQHYAIADAGALSSQDFDAPQRSASFWQAFGKSQKPSGGSPQITPNVSKALTLAALEVLGATGQQSETWINNFMTTPLLNQCTNWARLHADQCLAAGHYKFEDAFCIAEHELSDLSECLTKSAL